MIWLACLAASLLGFAFGLCVGFGVWRVKPAPTPAPTPKRPPADLTPGAAECARVAAEVFASASDDGALADIASGLVVEAYGRGMADLRDGVIASGCLPDALADEVCNIAMARMEGR